ncbi:polysaccharide biosynthesis C-terminal domain-containing protein [Acinetobacter nectaris]|uniref:polysaccharide biosynthesis C-terminal domain-containing protein n=1 Tax=Acinetobacter nectaris TaxID=1219382 RepID=UPI001F268C25|nr:polysaccharide biosynthesis C-terminal domain-containing protein [Acinetobacter nectaris]MCF9045706.1 polysaccharide biosynthesis C-terminal domain-containing protein [Acinetobacter nectaris]
MSSFRNINFSVFTNALWVVAEKSLSIFGLIFVTSLVAKYIGPENFGKLIFVSSIFAILQTLSMFGSENIIFQKTSLSLRVGQRIIETTALIRNYIYIILSLLLNIYLYFTVDFLTFIYSLATSIAVLFSLQDVYNIYFDAQLKSKLNVICNTIGLGLSLFLRFIIVELHLNLYWFSMPIIVLTLIPYLIRFYLYRKYKIKTKKIGKKNISKYRGYMLVAGGNLVLYSLSIVIYTKVCQLFLGWKSQHELGIYSIAITLGTSYYFVLNAIISSYMTQVYREKNIDKANNMVSLLNLIVFLISLCAFLFIYIFGKDIIQWLYGSAYKEVNEIILYMVVVCFFSGIATVADKYIIGFNGYKYLRNKNIFLVLFNIFLAFYLIDYYGIYGAVIAIFITEVLSSTVLTYFFKKGIVFKTQYKMFFLKGILLGRKDNAS